MKRKYFVNKILSSILGPLTYTSDGKTYLVGVVSWGGIDRNGELPCGQQGLPGVYARVSSVRSWIDDHPSKHC